MSLGIDDSSLKGVLQQGTSLIYQCWQSLAMHRDLENLCLWNERRGGSPSLTGFTYLPSCNHLNIQGHVVPIGIPYGLINVYVCLCVSGKCLRMFITFNSKRTVRQIDT